MERNKTESGWGPNAVFRFPQEGGTGAIWTKVAGLLPKDKQMYNKTVTNLDPVKKLVTFQDGTVIQYNKVLQDKILCINIVIQFFLLKTFVKASYHLYLIIINDF